MNISWLVNDLRFTCRQVEQLSQLNKLAAKINIEFRRPVPDRETVQHLSHGINFCLLSIRAALPPGTIISGYDPESKYIAQSEELTDLGVNGRHQLGSIAGSLIEAPDGKTYRGPDGNLCRVVAFAATHDTGSSDSCAE